MRLRIGVVQSTSSVPFLGIAIVGDCCAIRSGTIVWELSGASFPTTTYPAGLPQAPDPLVRNNQITGSQTWAHRLSCQSWIDATTSE
jgi:hypothetical protein